MMTVFLLAFALSASAAQHAATPLPAEPPPEEGRVMFDSDSEREELPPPTPPGKAGVKAHGLGRLVSVDAKERKVVLEHEDGVEQAYQVPDSARLSFAADERPLMIGQLRRGDAVAYAVEGARVVRLHLELGGDPGEDDPYVAPRPRRRPPARRPPPVEEPVPEFPVNEPDTPMYMSEPGD
ncbi:MAG: hypothetical protein HYZ75_13370 [Elusimicrobia bacterium]|nr:hypothetical protein [Elusimicrobiota bacterium]